MSFYDELKPAIDHAIANPVRSRIHDFTTDEQRDYNSLRASGRTLYDTLRTDLDWSHDDAMYAAVDRFGYIGFNAKRDDEQ